MKGMLKGYLIFLAGALGVAAWAWWAYASASGENLTSIVVRARASRNGHVPAAAVPAVEE